MTELHMSMRRQSAAATSIRVRIGRLLAIGVFAPVLVACSGLGQSQVARLYAIDLPAASSGLDCAISFSIRDLTLAGYLDRLEVVSERRNNEISASATELWAAPLKDELRRLIAVSLSLRWRASRAVGYPWRFQELPQVALSINVDRLDPSAGMFDSVIRWQAFQPADSGRANSLVAAGVHQRSRALLQTHVVQSNAAQTVRATALAIEDLTEDMVRQLGCPSQTSSVTSSQTSRPAPR